MVAHCAGIFFFAFFLEGEKKTDTFVLYYKSGTVKRISAYEWNSENQRSVGAVSYTHLTLPTIRLV